MPYQHSLTRLDHSEFAAGRVFLSAPGQPAFPVRLADEIFQRCLALRSGARAHERVTLYDPCCGSGYLLASLTYIKGEALNRVVGSDVAEDALELARRNLALLTLPGIDDRIRVLTELFEKFGKDSHADALASAARLRLRLIALTGNRTIPTQLFRADATNPADLQAYLAPGSVDLVITDVPYGQQTAWLGGAAWERAETAPASLLLEALRPILAPGAIVAIASDKGQRARHEMYRRVDRFQIGKRRIDFFRLE